MFENQTNMVTTYLATLQSLTSTSKAVIHVSANYIFSLHYELLGLISDCFSYDGVVEEQKASFSFINLA